MFKKGDIVTGEISLTTFGSGYVTTENIKKGIYVNKTNINKALHLDTVKIELTKVERNQFEGKVIEIIERFKTDFVGTMQISEKHAFFIPDNKRMNVDIFIPLNKLAGASNNDKVVVTMTSWGDKQKNPNGEVTKVLGKCGDNDVEIHSILEEYNLPYEFKQNVINESELISEVISEKEISKRLDMRNVLTFTIDGETAKDLDDALSVEWVDGNIQVGVHIADVSHYVKPNTAIDDEAYKRGTSVYLVDRVVPMLPEKLSNNLCSLNPHTDKLVYSFIFTLDRNGKVINEKFCRGIINSNARLTYTQVQKVIEGGTLNEIPFQATNTFTALNKHIENGILDLHKYASKIRKIRSTKDSLKFRGTEVKFDLDSKGNPIGVYFTEQKESNWLIEEFMVLTNRQVCEFVTKKSVPTLHRTHDEPDPTRLESLKTFVESIGYKLDLSDDEKIKDKLNGLLAEVKGSPEENIISNLVVRCMAKANYQTKNIGHYGLGVQYYMHTTSPIRRYPDLIFHRIISDVLGNEGYLI
jgi:ribonuclease R